MSISARNIVKRFGNFNALDNVTVEAASGSLVALLGPSGSGKTTLLRIISGLEVPDAGSVTYHEDDVTDRSARDRHVGFVFQHYALFRHMTVFENVAFGLRVRKTPNDRVQHRVHELLKLVRLEEMSERYPAQLSGGQRQRIALIRALAPEPKVLLLDEPFGALDAQVRDELRQWLRRFHDEFHITSIFVTHDQAEAFEVADKIVVMNRGKVEQVGTPAQVFEHPVNAFVMEFLGNVNKIDAILKDGRVLLGNVEMPVEANRMTPGSNGKASVYVRPHELDLDRVGTQEEHLRVRVLHINPAGSVVKVRTLAEEFGLLINVDISPEKYRALALNLGEYAYVTTKSAKVFDPEYTI